jgi:hypothetical protein
MTKFYYNPKTHEYFINDIRVPSVTELLPKKDFHCSEDHLEKCREEGNQNHELVKMYFDYKRDTFSDPYLIAFDNFLKENEKIFGELLFYEKPLFHQMNDYQFGGTPDMVFENAILDNKRKPGNSKYHALQFAGYNILVNCNDNPKTIKWFICWYDGKKGKFKKRNIYNDKAKAVFMSLLKNYYHNSFVEQYFKAEKKDGEK